MLWRVRILAFLHNVELTGCDFYFVGVVTEWCKQIEQVLAESEQMRKEADDIGPNAELAHWKARMVKFNSITDQLKSPICKKVVGILNAVKSRALLKTWKDLDNRVTDAANESKVGNAFFLRLFCFLYLKIIFIG
jgi:dynein heavy chain, axonemal